MELVAIKGKGNGSFRGPEWHSGKKVEEIPPFTDLFLHDNKKPGNVIYLKERNFRMLKKDLLLRNPLRIMGESSSEDILPSGGFGAILARAGLGKTALLVQMAMDSLVRGRNVLHISLDESVKKVCLWYEEVFKNIAKKYEITQMNQLWEAILPCRFIMAFKTEGFSVPKLEERILDLTEQDIFLPQMILIDGFPFEETGRKPLMDLKELAKKYNMHVWFSVIKHRHEQPGPGGMPLSLLHVADLFEAALEIQPEGEKLYIKALQGQDQNHDGDLELMLDPETMLLTEKK